MKLGIIVHKIQDSNIFIVNVGWGQLRYFSSEEDYEEGDIVLYKETSFLYRWCESNDEERRKFYDTNQIIAISSFENCEFLGNVKQDFNSPEFSKSNIVIARMDSFVYWEGQKRRQEFDKISNSLLFLVYAEPRYTLPNEKDWLNAYSDARKKVEELDIPKMIEELKVEVHHYSWTRRGSDNVTFGDSIIQSNYTNFDGDIYLSAIFPEKYELCLCTSKDGDDVYIHPKYEHMKDVWMPDGSIKFEKAKFEGVDIDLFCTNKAKEMRQMALKNYESYNKEEHINSLAYNQLYRSKIYGYERESELFLKMKGQADLIWGFKFDKHVSLRSYKELIYNNNKKHPVPQFDD